MAATLIVRPSVALAAGTQTTSAQALKVHVGLLGGLVPIDVASPAAPKTWTTGGSTSTTGVLPATNIGVPLTGPNLLSVGAVNSTAGPAAGGGGLAQADVAGLTVLSTNTLSLGAIKSTCQMTPSDITTDVTIADLKVLGLTVNPDVNLAIGVPGVLTGTVDKRTATWDTSTGQLDYTVDAVNLSLLSGLSVVASGTVVVAEAKCSGKVKLGTVAATSAQIVPGAAAAPTVTVTNTGDIAAPNTTITIPAPPTGYTLGTVTTTGGGTCAGSGGSITCTGVTVPGSGSVQVTLPVTLAASATAAADWTPTAGTITATSKPITGTSATMTISGAGSLTTVQPARSTGGSFTVTPMNVTAGKANSTTITVRNDGPSDATTTVTIPIGTRPAGVSVVSAAVGGSPCVVGATTITCSAVTVPGGGTATIDLRAAATNGTTPGTQWALSGIAATLNGTAVSGQGTVLTVTDPDVNLAGGVTITGVAATPGAVAGVTTTVQVRNVGATPATGTTITLPAPPAGYTVGSVTTSGNGTCTSGVSGISCTGVTIPAAGSVTVSVPVTIGSGVTAGWSGTATATHPDSTGSATGPFVTVTPRYTLGASANAPAPRTVLPGQTATMTVAVLDQGPSDARRAPFVVVAPANTTFGPLTGTANTLCTALTSTTIRCTVDMAASDPAISLSLPLAVSAQADPATPVTGGCVSLDNDSSCAGPADAALPAFQLKTPLQTRLTTTLAAATIVPGTSGTSKIGLTSVQAETALTVGIPLGTLPTGFTVTSATIPGGNCTVGASAVTCTGVDLTANTRKDLSLGVTVDQSVTPPQTWNATAISVTGGGESATAAGSLAGTGTVSYTLTATVTGPADGTVEPGDSTSLSVVTTNAGPSSAAGASFTVSAPRGTVFGALSGTTANICTVSSSTLVTCSATLAANASTPALTLPLTVSANADVSTPVSGGCVDLDGIANCGAADVAVPAFNLKVPFSRQVSVTATPVTVTPGTSGSATVKVTAGAYGNLTGLTVTVPLTALPSGLSVTAVTGPGGSSCTRSATQVQCTGVDVTSSGTVNLGLTVAATPGSTTGTIWTAAGITVAGSGSITSDQQLAAVGAGSAPLSVVATGPGSALLPGATGTIGVTVTNPGPSDASPARFTVVAPAGTTLAPLTGATALACTAVDSTHASCTFNLAAGASPAALSFPLKVDATATPGSTLTGGCFDLDGTPGCAGAADVAIPAITVATPLGQQLSDTTTAATITPGTSGTGTLTINSSVSRTGLTVTIPTTGLPAGFTAGAATVAGGTCTGTSPIVCTGVDVTAGTAKVVSIPVAVAANVPAGRTWTASGIAIAGGAETALAGGDLATSTAPVTTVLAAVTVPAAATVLPGGTADVTVVATDTGPSDATGATFTVRAPAGTTFDTLTGTAATLCTATYSTLITCTAPLAAGASTPVLHFGVLVPASADPFTPITGGCADVDGTPGCGGAGDTAIAPIVLKVPFPNLVAVTTGAALPVPGATANATLGVTATHGDLTNVVISVPLAALPAGVTVGAASANGGATCGTSGGIVTCTDPSILNGQTTTVTLPVSAGSGVSPGTGWTATGVTVGTGADQIGADRTLATVAAVQYTLNPVVSVPVGAIEPGGTGTLSVTVGNTGPSDAAAAAIGVLAPAGATFTSAPAPCTLASPMRVSCLLTLTAGATAALPIPFTVDPAANPATPLTGGCVDRGNDGVCGAGDPALPSIALAEPFTQQVTVTTTPATITPGHSGTASAVISSDQTQTGLTVVIPLAGLPGTITTPATSTSSTTGTCVTGAGQIRCTGVDVAAGNQATISVPVTVDGTATANTIWSTGAIVVTNASNATATGGGLLVRAGSPVYALSATFAMPSDGTVLPGTASSMTVNLANGTASSAIGAPVAVTAPAGTTFGTLTGAAARDCTVTSPTTLQCALTTNLVLNDPPLAWTLPLNVSASAASPVTGGCLDLDGNGSCETPISSFALQRPLAALLTATAAPVTVTPGTSATATVSVTAAQALTGPTLTVDTATVPAGLTVTGATFGGTACPATANTFTCTGVDLAANTAKAVVLTVSAAPTAVPATSWTPAVSVAAAAQTAVLHPLTVTLGAVSNALTVTVAVPAPGTVLPGGTGELSVTMTNAGPSALPRAHTLIKAPGGSTFTTPTGDAATYCTLSSPTLADCTADLGVEARTFALGILVAPTADPAVALVGGCADVDLNSACGAGDPVIPALTLAKPLSSQAQLGLTPATVTPGAYGTGYVSVTADRQLTGLIATVPLTALPAGLTVTGFAGPVASTCAQTPTQIICTGLSVPSGTTARLIAVTLKAAAGDAAGITWAPGPITLTDGTGATSQTSGTLAVTGTASPQIAYAVSAPTGTVSPGGTATLTTTVTNAGPSDATGVATRILAPAGTTFGPLTGGAATACTVTSPARLDCRFDLAAGAQPLIWPIPLQIPAATTANTDLTGGCVDVNLNNACGPAPDTTLSTVHVSATIAQAVTVTAAPATIVPGRTGTATVTLASTRTATGLTVSIPTDHLPTGVTVTQAGAGSGTCTIAVGAITCTGVRVTAGGTTAITLSTSVHSNATPATTWTPAVTVTEAGQSTTSGAISAVTVGAADIALAVTAGAPAANTLKPGDSGEITVAVANTGSSNATGVHYAVLAPAGATFGTPTGSSATYCTRTSATRMDCTLNVAGSARLQFPLPITISPTADPATPLTGGCVDLAHDGACTAGTDVAVPSIQLATPLSGTLQIAGTPASIVPGRTGTGVVRITATAAVTGTTVAIPLTGLPAGLTVTGASGPVGSTCAIGTTTIRCTGVNLASGATNAVSVVFSAASSMQAAVSWRPAAVTVTAGTETATGPATLVTTDTRVSPVTWTAGGIGATVRPGATTTMTVSATNGGPSDTEQRTATLTAPAHTTFGPLTGRAATDCQVAGATRLTCTYGLTAASSLQWVLPLTVSADAVDGDKITGACVTADNGSSCAGDGVVDTGGGQPSTGTLPSTGKLTLGAATIKPGSSGTATISVTATAAYPNLTLTIPLTTLPTGFTIGTATMDGAVCTVGSTAVTCTAMTLTANQAAELNLGVAVAKTVAKAVSWPVSGITVTDPANTANKLTASGVLVTTSAPDYSLSVTVGTPTVAMPAPGLSTTVPVTVVNNGPGAATAAPVQIVLPDGTTHGDLPAGCLEGAGPTIVICTITVPAGESVTVQVPIVVDPVATPGDTIGGGCLDGVLATNAGGADGSCGGDTDVPLPSFTIGKPKVNLSIGYSGGTVPVSDGGTILVKLPYGNSGTEMAAGVVFTITPPAGVTVRKAAVLLDGSTASSGSASSNAASSGSASSNAASRGNAATSAVAAAGLHAAHLVSAALASRGGAGLTAAASTVDLDCTTTEGVVTCDGPDQANGAGSQLWLTLSAVKGVKAGTYPVKVKISTTSAEGNVTDNLVSVPLKLAGTASGGDSDTPGTGGDTPGSGGGTPGSGSDLPKTGADIALMAAASMLLMLVGTGFLISARDPGLASTLLTGSRRRAHRPAHRRRSS